MQKEVICVNVIKVNGSALYQWDTDRSVEVTPWQNYTVDEVHFTNPNSDSALVVMPTVENGEVVAPIPNILLQTPMNIRILAVMHTDNGERTVSERVVGVIARQKPADYVYTETEVRTYEALAERINTLEQNGVPNERISQAIADYLAENPVESFTKEELAAAIEAYFAENPIEGGTVSDEQIADAVEDYFAEHPIESPDSGGNVELDTTLTQSGKAADAKAVGGVFGDLAKLKGYTSKTTIADMLLELFTKAQGNTGGGTTGTLSDTTGTDIPEVSFTSDIWGEMTKENPIDVAMTYASDSLTWNGYANIKWQGSSSLNYDKKNFTVKLYEDETMEEKQKIDFNGWGLQNKFCLKANYIDHSHARNIVSARLWNEIVESRSNYASLPEALKTSPNNGAIDGFPIKVTVNGVYQGIYTWNIPKDAWMFNMDEDNVNHCVLCAETNNGANSGSELSSEFRSEFNTSDWSVEFPEAITMELKASFNNLINCVKNTDDKTFVVEIRNYLDVQSAIDYYIYAYFGAFIDNLGKNLLMLTYDGVKWFCSMYDMDSTWGLGWTGGYFVSPTVQCPEGYQETRSLLFERIEKLMAKEIKERYTALRNNVLSSDNIVSKFAEFMNIIGDDLYEQDLVAYPSIPNGSVDHLQQITNFVSERSVYVDAEIENLVEMDTSIVNVTGLSLDKETMNLDITSSTPGLTKVEIIYPSENYKKDLDGSTGEVVEGIISQDVVSEKTTVDPRCSYLLQTILVNGEMSLKMYFYDSSDKLLQKTEFNSNTTSFLTLNEQATYLRSKGKDTDLNGTIDSLRLYKIDFDSIGLVEFENGVATAGDKYTDAIVDVEEGDIFILVNNVGPNKYYTAITKFDSSDQRSIVSGTDNKDAINVYTVESGITKIGIKYNGSIYVDGSSVGYKHIKASELGTGTVYGEGTLTATITPSNANNQIVKWTTTDDTKVSVTSDGLSATIKAKAPGSATVICTSNDTANGTISDSCEVTITEK